jgi:hypothetical protein
LLVLVLFVQVLVCFYCPVASLFLALRVLVVGVPVVQFQVPLGLELVLGQGDLESEGVQYRLQIAECAGSELAILDFELQFAGNCNTKCS